MATITCAMCRKPVDRYEIFQPDLDGSRKMRAYCHGAMDEATINWRQLPYEALRGLESAQGVAFSGAALIERLPE